LDSLDFFLYFAKPFDMNEVVGLSRNTLETLLRILSNYIEIFCFGLSFDEFSEFEEQF